jgi:hypothetical protein
MRTEYVGACEESILLEPFGGPGIGGPSAVPKKSWQSHRNTIRWQW